MSEPVKTENEITKFSTINGIGLVFAPFVAAAVIFAIRESIK